MRSEKVFLYKVVRLINYIAYIIISLLLIRFVLRLFGANPSAGFVDFIYSASGFFLVPFRFMFTDTSASPPGSIIEWSTLVAILVYYLIALAIVKLLAGSRSVGHYEAERYLEEEDRE